jgi:hypothetical protein
MALFATDQCQTPSMTGSAWPAVSGGSDTLAA